MGVFPQSRAPVSASARLPHARGGVSSWLEILNALDESSPRPWGCFLLAYQCASTALVFPTPVGVFPGDYRKVLRPISLPHARGGVS